MDQTVVVYTNEDGFREFRRVPNGYSPTMYNQGIIIGPPDLISLKISKKQRQEINNFLVDEGIVSYENLLGKKRLLLGMLTEMGFKENKASQLRQEIISLYQQELINTFSE